MRRVGAIGDIDRVDAAALLLGDTLVNPLGARALDADRDARIFGLERLAQPLGDIELQRGIIGELAFFARGFDQFGRHAGWRRRCSLHRFGEHGGRRERGRSLQHLASGPLSIAHGVVIPGCATFARGFSRRLVIHDDPKRLVTPVPKRAKTGGLRFRLGSDFQP